MSDIKAFKVSELEKVQNVGEDDLLLVSKVQQNGYSTKSMKVGQLASYLNEQHDDEQHKIMVAILNELKGISSKLDKLLETQTEVQIDLHGGRAKAIRMTRI